MRTARKLTAVAASAALIGAGSLLAATPAHAATSVSVVCNGSSSVLTGNAFTFSVPASCTNVRLATGGLSTSVTFAVNGVSKGPGVDTTLPAGTSTVVLLYTGSSDGAVGIELDGSATDYVIFLSGGGGSSSNSTARGAAPAPVIQQFGKPASGTCEEAAPAALNLAGVGSGGWGESWAQWMNGGSGGAVCTRTLSYVGSGWTVS